MRRKSPAQTGAGGQPVSQGAEGLAPSPAEGQVSCRMCPRVRGFLVGAYCSVCSDLFLSVLSPPLNSSSLRAELTLSCSPLCPWGPGAQ